MCLGDDDPRMHCNVKELIILAQVVPLIYLVLLHGSIEGSLVWNRAIETHRATVAFLFLCVFLSHCSVLCCNPFLCFLGPCLSKSLHLSYCACFIYACRIFLGTTASCSILLFLILSLIILLVYIVFSHHHCITAKGSFYHCITEICIDMLNTI